MGPAGRGGEPAAGALFALRRVRAGRSDSDGRAERRRGRPAQRGGALFEARRRYGDFVRRPDVAANEDRRAEVMALLLPFSPCGRRWLASIDASRMRGFSPRTPGLRSEPLTQMS